MSPVLRPASPGDVGELAALERRVFGAEAWSPAAIGASLERRDAVAFVVVDDSDAEGVLLGGAWGWSGGGASELLRVAVLPEARRQGLGARLVRALAAACAGRAADELWLEVRADNAGAIALYEALGLARTGRRAAYYEDGCDAVLMGVALPLPRG